MKPDEIEQEIQDKGLTAPRVTLEDIEANIVSEHCFTAADGVDGADIALLRGGCSYLPLILAPLDEDQDIGKTTELGPIRRLTFCVLILRNGFTVTGESACVSQENFDAELGRKIARQNAIAKVLPLMGYALRDRLFLREEK
jgi:hypothetical protein